MIKGRPGGELFYFGIALKSTGDPDSWLYLPVR